LEDSRRSKEKKRRLAQQNVPMSKVDSVWENTTQNLDNFFPKWSLCENNFKSLSNWDHRGIKI